MDDNLDSLFDTQLPDCEIETTKSIAPQQFRAFHKRRLQAEMKEKRVENIIGELPKPGESIHMVSGGRFDYWNFVPVILRMNGDIAACAYFSTWTLNRQCVTELLDLFDSEKIKSIRFLTGLYFKRRETSVYAQLATGLLKRKQQLRALENHAKIILLDMAPNYYVMEGSANFTSNPRIEQNCLTNDESLFRFHQGWFDRIFED